MVSQTGEGEKGRDRDTKLVCTNANDFLVNRFLQALTSVCWRPPQWCRRWLHTEMRSLSTLWTGWHLWFPENSNINVGTSYHIYHLPLSIGIIGIRRESNEWDYSATFIHHRRVSINSFLFQTYEKYFKCRNISVLLTTVFYYITFLCYQLETSLLSNSWNYWNESFSKSVQ